MKGYTLTELLAVLAIIGILAAFGLAAAQPASLAARAASSKSNLRQISVSLELYRSDHDGDGRWGTYYQTGLPPSLPGNVPAAILGSPCGLHPLIRKERPHAQNEYAYYLPFDDDQEADLVRSMEDRYPMVIDLMCNAPNVHPYSTSRSVRALGVRLDGSLDDFHAQGRILDRSWWKVHRP